MNETQPVAVIGDLISRGDGTYILKPRAATQWIPASEAAKIMAVSHRTIVRWAVAKRVVARRAGPKLWQIDSASLVFDGHAS